MQCVFRYRAAPKPVWYTRSTTYDTVSQCIWDTCLTKTGYHQTPVTCLHRRYASGY